MSMQNFEADDNTDDWRSIQDPKVRKRIQNRLAQRVYRRRFKQRLEDLQQQLEENQKFDAEEQVDGIGKSNVETGGSGSHMESPMMTPDWALTQQTSCFEDANTYALNTTQLQPASSGTPAHASALSWHEQMPWDTASLLYASTTQPSQPSEPIPIVTATPSPGILHDAIGLSNDVFPWNSSSTVPLPTPSLSSGLSPSETCSARGRASVVSTHSAISQGKRKQWASMIPSAAASEAEDKLPHEMSLEKRLGFVLAAAHCAGFAGFDDLISRYYNSALDEETELAQDQRLSRNRGLPTLLSDLRTSSQAWSTWERSGYQQEILLAAEAICTKEIRDMAERSADALQMQEELPNTWALLMGLTASSPFARQRSRSHAVFACMNLLHGLANFPSIS